MKPLRSTRSCQIATALRPLASSTSISSWNGRHALADGLRAGTGGSGSVVTGVVALAGFEISGSVVTPAPWAGFDNAVDAESVVTSMAGFAPAARPQRPGARTDTPADRKYAAAVSRRTP